LRSRELPPSDLTEIWNSVFRCKSSNNPFLDIYQQIIKVPVGHFTYTKTRVSGVSITELEVYNMSSQYIRPITNNSPSVQNPFARDSKLLYSKIANISHLVESLNSAVEDLGALNVPQIDEQFDFYHEVERFEINLLQSALRISGGSQVKAAKLLKLNPTTLNAKLKLFGLNTK